MSGIINNRQKSNPLTRLHQVIDNQKHRVEYIFIIVSVKDDIQLIKLHCDELEKIPFFVSELDSIMEIYLDSCSFSDLPPWFNKLSNLEILYLYNCKLRSLPEVIGKLKNLRLLYLYNNNFNELPEFIYNLTNLQYLFIPYNYDDEEYFTDGMLKLKNLHFIHYPLVDDKFDYQYIEEYLQKKKEND